jgi:hypothetical protein
MSLYMFRALNAHLQEDTLYVYIYIYMQHMVLSLSTRVRGGLSVHSVHRQVVYCESHTKHITAPCGQNSVSLRLNQVYIYVVITVL